MRILLCNKFYYRRGGDCIYMLALEDLLKRHGHEVAVFAMQHPDNLATPWSKYFPSEVDFHNKRHLFKTLGRPLGLSTVARRFEALLDDFKPDVVHFNNIHSQLSPIIVSAAHRRNIATVWTMHDYKLLCPRYDCLQCGKTPCTECTTDARAVIRHRCMKGSLAASVLAYAEMKRWSHTRVAEWVDAFIAPSHFMHRQLTAAGIDERRVHTMHHFIDAEQCAVADYSKEDYCCFVGRLSPEKGIETLLKAAQKSGLRLQVIGDGPLRTALEEQYGSEKIVFTGFLPWPDIKERVRRARVAVVPSEWYEVFGLVIMEAQCLGTPVVGARMGGIPELIDEGRNGSLFAPGNVEELQSCLQQWFTTQDFDYAALARSAQQRYDVTAYYSRLCELYESLQNHRSSI